MHGDRDITSDRAAGSVLVVELTQTLQLFADIRKAHEQVRVQTFHPELAVERFDEPVAGGFPQPCE